jgi:hypothetical protein
MTGMELVSQSALRTLDNIRNQPRKQRVRVQVNVPSVPNLKFTLMGTMGRQKFAEAPPVLDQFRLGRLTGQSRVADIEWGMGGRLLESVVNGLALPLHFAS